MRKKIITFVIALCLIIPCMLGLVACSCDSGTAKTMKTSINPEITFALDADNKITSISYGNEDAGRIYANVNFVGKDVDSAIQIMIEQSAISGHVDLNGDEITFEINGSNDADIEALKKQAQAKAEEVFNNLGVEVSVKFNELTAELSKQALINTAIALAPEKDVEEIKEMTNEELIALIDQKQKDYEGLVYDQIQTIQNSFDKLILNAIETARTAFKTIEAQMEKLGNSIPQEIKNQYNTLKTQLDEKIEEFLNARKADIKSAKAVIDAHKEVLVNAYKAEVAEAQTAFIAHIDSAKENNKITEQQYNYWKSLVENTQA